MAESSRDSQGNPEPDGGARDLRLVERRPGQADPDGACITEILNGIPGAWERAQESIEQARRGETMPLSEL